MTNFKNFATAFISLFIFSGATHAQTAQKANYQINYSEPFVVKYLGCDEDYLLFEVSVQSPNFNNAMFEIVDKNEGELFAYNFTKGLTVKTLKIEKRDDQVLNFKLVLDKKIYSRSFSVVTTEVEKTTVSESDISKL